MLLFTLISLLCNCSILDAQTIWTGPTMTFTKANFADWTLEENQDRITDNIWITRANTQGIFNIVYESGYTEEFSPADTRWAFGTTANYDTLEYDSWEETIGTPVDMMDLDMVVHLVTDDIYIDIKFTAWTSGGNGGGFTYERSKNQILGLSEFSVTNDLKVFPNPSTDFIRIENLQETVVYKIYNILGMKIDEGVISSQQKIPIANMKSGMYVICLNQGTYIRFVKT